MNDSWRYVADLIHFGAVYYALVQPEPPTTASQEQIQLYEKFTSPCFLKQRQSLKGKTIREAQKTFRITHVDEYVEVGTYLRVYVHPRRFPRCYEIDWKSRIIAVTKSYVVLDKPAGTSVRNSWNASQLHTPMCLNTKIFCFWNSRLIANKMRYFTTLHQEVEEFVSRHRH